jgi:hypothetical protein
MHSKSNGINDEITTTESRTATIDRINRQKKEKELMTIRKFNKANVNDANFKQERNRITEH